MEIDFFVVGLGVFAGNKSAVLVWIGCHHTGCNRFFDLIIKSRDTVDTYFFLAVVSTPDRKRSTPVTASGQIPVLKILEPFAKTPRTGRRGFPFDCLIECYKPVFDSRSLDKPTVEGIIDHRLVCAPAMRVIMSMLLDAECVTGLLHLHTYHDVEVFGLRSGSLVILAARVEARIISVLDEITLMPLIQRDIDTALHESIGALIGKIILAREVDHRTGITIACNHEQRRYAGRLGNFGVVSAECRRDMDDARTIFGCDIIAGDNPESDLVHHHKGIFTYCKTVIRIRSGKILDKSL